MLIDKKCVHWHKFYISKQYVRYYDITKIKCKDFYWFLIQRKYVRPKALEKWEETYYYVQFDWKNIYSIPYLCCRETSLQSMQYKIINRYFPCRFNINKWYPNESQVCTFCDNNLIDYIEHYFAECRSLGIYWQNFNQWWRNTTEIIIRLATVDIIFGIPNELQDDSLATLNYCLLFAKQFIYRKKKDNKEVNFNAYKCQLKMRLESERYIYESTGTYERFELLWKTIFDSL